MNANHNHEWLEEIERLLQQGQPAADSVLNDLASTVPEARPAFQQQLEEQLVSVLQSDNHSTGVSTMQVTNFQTEKERLQREQRGFPLTLAVAVAVLLLGLAIVLMMAAPKPDEPGPQAFAAMGEGETATPIWSPEATLKAAESDIQTATPFLSPPAQVTGTSVPPTVDPNLDPIMRTATAIIARATFEAAVTTTAEAPPQSMSIQATVVRPDAGNGTICQIVDPTGNVMLHTQPRAESAVVGRLPAELRLEVTTVVIEAQSGATWLYVEYQQMGQVISGWVRAADVRVLAICFYDNGEYALPNGAPEQTGLLQPTVMPPTATAPFTSTYTMTPTATHTATPMPTITPTVTASAMPSSAAGVSLEVNIQVADPQIVDLFPLVGELVDVFMAVGDVGQGPALVAVARRVRLIKVSGENITSATVIARDTDQAELLVDLAASGVEIRLAPSE